MNEWTYHILNLLLEVSHIKPDPGEETSVQHMHAFKSYNYRCVHTCVVIVHRPIKVDIRPIKKKMIGVTYKKKLG